MIVRAGGVWSGVGTLAVALGEGGRPFPLNLASMLSKHQDSPNYMIPCWPTTIFVFTSARSYRPARRRSDHFACLAVHPVRSSPARPGPPASPTDQTEALR